jgi:hypothetical protein
MATFPTGRIFTIWTASSHHQRGLVCRVWQRDRNWQKPRSLVWLQSLDEYLRNRRRSEKSHRIAMYIDANSKGEYYDPMGLPPYQDAYVAFLNKLCTSWTYNAVRVQEEGSTVCRQHCIYYLIHRCRGYSMTNITGLLKNPKEATDIVKTIVYINKT